MKNKILSVFLMLLLLVSLLSSQPVFAETADTIRIALIGDHFAVGNSDGAFLGLKTPIAAAVGDGFEVESFGGNDFSSTSFYFDKSYKSSQEYDPHIVIIALGTKDCQVADVEAGWEEYLANIQEFVDVYHNLGAKVILLTPTKSLNDLTSVGIDWTGNSGIFADRIKANPTELGVDAIVDVYTASIDNDLYGCYINDAACTAVAEELRDLILAMKDTLPEKPVGGETSETTEQETTADTEKAEDTSNTTESADRTDAVTTDTDDADSVDKDTSKPNNVGLVVGIVAAVVVIVVVIVILVKKKK